MAGLAATAIPLAVAVFGTMIASAVPGRIAEIDQTIAISASKGIAAIAAIAGAAFSARTAAAAIAGIMISRTT